MTIPGSVRVGGFIAPTLLSDPYATHDDQYGKGGFRAVADLTARDAITAERRVEGMWVKVLSEDKVYTLSGGITNGDWLEQTMGGAGGAMVDATTYYVDGDIGDDANDGLAWLTAKKTFGFLLPTATDAIPHEINAAFVCNFRNNVSARDAGGHLYLNRFWGTGSITFTGTLTAATTLTCTTYENDPTVRHARISVTDPTKAWTPGEWRRHFLKIDGHTSYYPIYDNDDTTLYFPRMADIAGTPAATIYSASELLSELVSDPGVKYEFGTWPSIYFGINDCRIPVAVSNAWVDEALAYGDTPNFRHNTRVSLTRVAGLSSFSENVDNLDYVSCYFNTNNTGYVFDAYSQVGFALCAVDSSDSTGWGINFYQHSYGLMVACIFNKQFFGLYIWAFTDVLCQRDTVFRNCEYGITLGTGMVEFIDPYGTPPGMRFDTCTTCLTGNGVIGHFEGVSVEAWDASTEILFGTTDDAEFSELNARTLQSRNDLNLLYYDLNFVVLPRNEYDNTTSGLTARRYQTAIDEIVAAGGGGTYIATFAETSIDLVDNTDFTAVEPSNFWTEGMGYTLEITPTSATGNLTVILYQDTARLVPVYILISDLSDADTWRSSEAFGFELETAGTLYGTAFVSGAEPGKVFDISLSTVVVQPSDPPEPLVGPYGDGIEDDGGGLPRIAFPSDGGFAFAAGKLELKPDITADVYPTLSAAGVAIANAVTTTTDEVLTAKKIFAAVGTTRLLASGPPVAGTYSLGHEVLDDTGIQWRCISGGTPGSWVLSDSVADSIVDYETGLLTPGDSEVVEILTTGDVGFFQHIQIWGAVAVAADYSSEFRARIYQTSSILGREMVWQGIGAVKQSYLTAILPAATTDCTVNDEDVFETDEACVVYEDGTRYELARISSRTANTLSFDEVLVDPLSWAANTLVCSVAQFDMVPFRNTDGTPANRGRAFLQIRNDHVANDVTFYIRVMPISVGVTGGSLS